MYPEGVCFQSSVLTFFCVSVSDSRQSHFTDGGRVSRPKGPRLGIFFLPTYPVREGGWMFRVVFLEVSVFPWDFYYRHVPSRSILSLPREVHPYTSATLDLQLCCRVSQFDETFIFFIKFNFHQRHSDVCLLLFYLQ